MHKLAQQNITSTTEKCSFISVVVYFRVADNDYNFCLNDHHSINFQVNANLVSLAGKIKIR